MKVLFLANIPSPYRVAFFNELGKLCDLTVLFERHNAADRDERWDSGQYKNFNAVFLKGIKIGTDASFSLEYLKYLKKDKFDVIVLAGYSSPTGILSFMHCRLHKIPYIISTDGAFMREERGLKYKFKRFLLSKAKAALVTNEETKKYINTYGISEDKIYIYPFTSLYQAELLQNIIGQDEKEALKEKLGIKENKVVISVGRFIHVKGNDVLLNSWRSMPSNVGLYIIGGTPTDEYLNMVKEFELKNVHFVDFMSKENLLEYYKASDLFVLATRGDVGGLVINEAMACGLPIITTDRCGAGLALVKEDKNGHIVPVDDSNALAKKINEAINDEQKLIAYSKESLRIIRDYTFQNMAKAHIEVFKKL